MLMRTSEKGKAQQARQLALVKGSSMMKGLWLHYRLALVKGMQPESWKEMTLWKVQRSLCRMPTNLLTTPLQKQSRETEESIRRPAEMQSMSMKQNE